jgi:hypothetical protein
MLLLTMHLLRKLLWKLLQKQLTLRLCLPLQPMLN